MSNLLAEIATPETALSVLFASLTKFVFFTGKGGVGKTSLACASAVSLADRGRRVLLVSTDPASNLDEVLEQKIGNSPTPIFAVKGLSALNIDPAAAARAYRERIISPYRGQLPEVLLRSMEEQLSGACTTEIAGYGVGQARSERTSHDDRSGGACGGDRR